MINSTFQEKNCVEKKNKTIILMLLAMLYASSPSSLLTAHGYSATSFLSLMSKCRINWQDPSCFTVESHLQESGNCIAKKVLLCIILRINYFPKLATKYNINKTGVFSKSCLSSECDSLSTVQPFEKHLLTLREGLQKIIWNFHPLGGGMKKENTF